ncbi:hypothetical protein [Sorangium sp. So ce233]|uniref:hypothetical protein n=1 Tax=Sorangium sp. So ce233 TaxID=3133290 RepID=UPI003F5F4ECC
MNRELLCSSVLGVLLAACGSPPAMTLTGSGGAGGEDGASSTGGGGEGGGAPVSCGGSLGDTCSETEYCDIREPGAEVCDEHAIGVCVARPRVGECPEDCPGVCGCDQRVHCNECLARAAGVRASKDTSCSSGEYVVGVNDRVYVHSADLEANRCLTLSLAWPTESDPRFTGVELPEHWALLEVMLTGEMRDCTAPRTPDDDGLHVVIGATGAMSWEPEPDTGIPCVIDMDVTVALEGEPGTYHVEATGVVVDNTCLW